MPWWLAGICIGLLVVASFATLARGLGVSGGFAHACALVTRSGPFAGPAFGERPNTRVTFLAGLVIGGAIASGGGGAGLAMGSLTTQLPSLPAAAGVLALGGLLIGFGTRLAGGCTSGHGITGSAERDPSSWLATATFMACACTVAHALRAGWGL